MVCLWRRSVSCLSQLCILLVIGATTGRTVWAQGGVEARDAEVAELRQTVKLLEQRVAALEQQMQRQQPPQRVAAVYAEPAPSAGSAATDLAEDVAFATPNVEVPLSRAEAQPQDVQSPAASTQKSLPVPTQLPGGATLNYLFDGYYQYDFNHPLGRVVYLRAYDVLSNAFSLNQADVVFDLDPDVSAGRRYGVRLDLQYGQATSTLQGNPNNEPRPDIYRNIYQAYGTYVFPVKQGWTVDFGKWSSSIGIEGNYTKDQMNYSRSYWFNFLPFYHMGVRSNFKVNDKLALNYWLVNGTGQTEPTNSFKDELFGYVLTPTKNISWTVNYYLGQDHADSAMASDCTVPLQPGLCQTPISPAPNGKLHIFDTYASWNATPKWTFALEGDYEIQREWSQAGPGMSSAPSHTDGGAAYARYQWTPKQAFAGRTEYMSDRGGLFSGRTQALKEFTGTYDYKVGEGLLTRLEYRRDWSNQPFFLTNKPGVLSASQDTLTVGLVWWYGGKEGAW